MDIGLVVTQDGLHYREPIPDFRIISAAEEPDGAHPSMNAGAIIDQGAPRKRRFLAVQN